MTGPHLHFPGEYLDSFDNLFLLEPDNLFLLEPIE